jgi:cystathionine beta-lyase
MAKPWTGQWRNLALRVEYRSLGSDGGTTLRIGPTDSPTSSPTSKDPDDLEWLRFDCFDENPHWHLAPGERDEVRPLDAAGDPVSEVFEMLDRALPKLLEQAGAPAPVVASVATDGGRTDESDNTDNTDDASRRTFFREAERAMRHRPAVLDELDIRLLERRRSAKWHYHPRDVLPAWVAEMDFPLAAPIQTELARLVGTSDVGYPLEDNDTGLPEAFRERMSDRFGWNPDPARVEVLSEVVQGMYIAIEAFTEVGDGAIVQTPIYPPFLSCVGETGRRLIENPLTSTGSRLDFDLDALPDLVDATTRIFLLCNPHNPSGRVMLREDLEPIAALALEHDLIVISDEIHADLLYDNRVHIPFASLGPEIAKRTVTLTSASKAFNIPGLRCAIAHFGTADLHQRFNQLYPPHIRGGIGLLGIYASVAAWRWGQPWLDEVVPYLQANRDYALQAFKERIPEIEFYSPEATYLAWLDCGALDIEGSPASHFMKHGRVALSGGRRFGAAWDRHVRVNFATSRSILAEIVDRMAKALGR